MRDLLAAVWRRDSSVRRSNGRASACGSRTPGAATLTFVLLLALAWPAREARAQAEPVAFLGGAAIALAAHEAGHLLFNIAFDADPRLVRVDFHGIPFFALTHRRGLSARREFTIAAAGFWVQHATNEWLLTTRPRLRHERAPLVKGLFAFNILASAAYSGAAFAKTGPFERDTRGMASALGADERWIGALILTPAVLDAWRYFDPHAKVPAWISRAVKVGSVVLVLGANAR